LARFRVLPAVVSQCREDGRLAADSGGVSFGAGVDVGAALDEKTGCVEETILGG
jgi:hypothetical protein